MRKNDPVKFTVLSVRANRSFRARLARIAKKEKRTLSAQAFAFLEEAVERAEQSESPAAKQEPQK